MKLIKIIFVLVLIVLFTGIATAQNIDYTYPNDPWVDRTLSLNQSGFGIIADNFTGDLFGNGSGLTGLPPDTRARGNNSYLYNITLNGDQIL